VNKLVSELITFG